MIDDFAHRENITKAAVITRALDCMQASYDSGNNGMPVTDSGSGISEQEFNDLKNQLKQAEERAQAAEQRANDAVLARDAAEAKAREAVADASVAAPIVAAVNSVSDDEIERLKALVAKQEASLEEKTKALARQGSRGRSKGGADCRARRSHHVSERAARCGKCQGSTGRHRSDRERRTHRWWWFTRRRFNPCADHA